MTKLFTRIELKHLKYRLINVRGMSPSEATREIAELLKEADKNHRESIKANKKARLSKPTDFQEGFKLLSRSRNVED